MKFTGTFLKNIQHIQAQLEKVLDAGLQDAAQKGAMVARQQGEFKSHGPNGLKSKIYAYRNDALSHGIIANASYASWVEFGNGPPGSRIYPKTAQALRFVIDGKVIFAKSVKASAPKPYMSKALAFENRSLGIILAQHLTWFFERMK